MKIQAQSVQHRKVSEKIKLVFIERSNIFKCDLQLINDDDANRTIGDQGPPGSGALLGSAPALLHSRPAGEAEEQRPSREPIIAKWAQRRGPLSSANQHMCSDEGEGARASIRRSMSERRKSI